MEIPLKRTNNPHADEQLAQLATRCDHWRSAGPSRRHPAVVLQDADYDGNLPVVLVVPLTTAKAAMRFAGAYRGRECRGLTRNI